MQQKTKAKVWGILVLVLLLLLTGMGIWYLGPALWDYVKTPERIRAVVCEHKLVGRVVYAALVIFQVLIALIPGEPLEILGGYAFGTIEGTVLCLGASFVGSMLVFGLVRRFGMRLVAVFFSKDRVHSLRFLKTTPQRDFIFLLIFTLPGTPKDLLCYFAGLTDIRLPIWVLICSLGRIPSIITSTMGGNALGTQSYWRAVIVFAVTVLISGLGMLLYQYICKRHEKRAD